MDRPCHVVFAPMVVVLSLFLLLGIATFRWDLLPGLVPLLLSLVRSVLFVSLLATLLVLILLVRNLSQLGVEFELALQRLDFSSHGYDLLVVGRLGSPLLLADEPIVFGFGHLEENIVGEYKLSAEIIFVLASDVDLKIVAGHDLVRIEEDLDGVVN